MKSKCFSISRKYMSLEPECPNPENDCSKPDGSYVHKYKTSTCQAIPKAVIEQAIKSKIVRNKYNLSQHIKTRFNKSVSLEQKPSYNSSTNSQKINKKFILENLK